MSDRDSPCCLRSCRPGTDRPAPASCGRESPWRGLMRPRWRGRCCRPSQWCARRPRSPSCHLPEHDPGSHPAFRVRGVRPASARPTFQAHRIPNMMHVPPTMRNTTRRHVRKGLPSRFLSASSNRESCRPDGLSEPRPHRLSAALPMPLSPLHPHRRQPWTRCPTILSPQQVPVRFSSELVGDGERCRRSRVSSVESRPAVKRVQF